MRNTPIRRRGRAAALLTGALIAAVPVPSAASAATTTVPGVSDAAAATLAAVPGSSLVVAGDQSDCMPGPTGQTVAFRSDRVLVRTTRSADDLLRSLTAHPAFAAAQLAGTPTVTSQLALPSATGTGVAAVVALGGAARDATQLLTLVRGLRADGIEASPDYALAPSGGPIGMWPYGPPEPTTAPVPTPRRARIGRGVTIALYDTGTPIDRFGAAAPTNLLDVGDIDKLDRNVDGLADLPYDGHTLAVASVIDTLAPGTEVLAQRILDARGVATDSTAAERLVASYRESFPNNLAGATPDILLMPFGTAACDGLPPLALQTLIADVVRDGRSLVVAAAGNRSTDRPFYPAAFDGVVAVGSLDLTADDDGNAWTSETRAGPRSAFSNYGRWVDAWAGGEHLVTSHVTGLAFYPGGPRLEGVAEVSGTSYAAPAVAALVAEGVARTGRPAPWVWRRLLQPSGTPCAASGGGVAVALTSMDSSFLERGERQEHRRAAAC